jgi:hypothetical protein
MTDIQILTLALAVIIPLSLLLLSNSRITDAKETLRADLRTGSTELRAEMQKGHAEILASLERIATQVKALETKIEQQMREHILEHHHN